MATFENEFDAGKLGSDTVTIKYAIDCAAKTIEFTVSCKVDEGKWLAIGLNDKAKMGGSDTYQMKIEDGELVVRNGEAQGTDGVDQDELLSGEGTYEDGVLTATWSRPLVAARDTDRTIEYGTPLHINLARGGR